MAILNSVIDHRFNVNSYILVENNNCIIIDSNINTYDYIIANKLIPELLFLTHEHFDHITGTTNLKQMFPQMKIISSKETSKLMQNSRDNMSFYYDGIGITEIGSDIFIEDISTFDFGGYSINTFYTPGHTTGGIVVQIDSMLFTGDTLLDIRTPTNMPNSSKQQLKESFTFIDNYFNENTIFYQGHGKPFYKKDWDRDISIGIKKIKK